MELVKFIHVCTVSMTFFLAALDAWSWKFNWFVWGVLVIVNWEHFILTLFEAPRDHERDGQDPRPWRRNIFFTTILLCMENITLGRPTRQRSVWVKSSDHPTPHTLTPLPPNLRLWSCACGVVCPIKIDLNKDLVKLITITGYLDPLNYVYSYEVSGSILNIHNYIVLGSKWRLADQCINFMLLSVRVWAGGGLVKLLVHHSLPPPC